MNATLPGTALPSLQTPRLNFLQSSKQHYGKVVFLLIHLSALTVFLVPVSWPVVALAVGTYYMRIFAITIAYHRYFSHRAFKTSRWFQFVLGCFGCSAVQKGPIWWAANHRHHHRHSDHEEDPHSPVRHGLWWAHIGWVISTRDDETRSDDIRDFTKYRELRILEELHFVPGLLLAGACYLIAGWSGLVWGFVVSTIFLYHGTFLVNSVCHVIGVKRWHTGDESRNNWWVALLTAGEGWHNNHHHSMSSARIGFRWWEIDLGWYGIKAMSMVGLVWDVRLPPPVAKTETIPAALATE